MLYACDKEIIKDLSAEEQLKIRDELINQGRYFDPTEVVDIYSRGNLEQSLLSNFRKTNFTLDGVQINSMEGLLQSLKTHDIEKQKEICLLTGKDAKKAGAEIDNYDGYNLYWQGKTFTRDSQEYQDFLKTAYEKRFENDPPFRNAILSTKDKILIHTIGKNNPEETILTTDEFIGILTDLRNKL